MAIAAIVAMHRPFLHLVPIGNAPIGAPGVGRTSPQAAPKTNRVGPTGVIARKPAKADPRYKEMEAKHSTIVEALKASKDKDERENLTFDLRTLEATMKGFIKSFRSPGFPANSVGETSSTSTSSLTK